MSRLVLLLLFVGSCTALYGRNSNVISLTKKNFDKEVMGSNDVWLVEFFAPWCGHCKQLTPAWELAATKLKGIVKVGAVDADQERELGGRFGIKGFPTIKAFRSPVGSNSKKKTPLDYNGGRTAKDIINYATSLLPAKNVAKLTKQDALDTFMKSELPKAILFSEKPTSPPLFTSMSLQFQDRMTLGFVPKKGSDEAILSDFGVSSFPAVIVVTEGGERVAFDGELKPDALSAFLSKHALPGKGKPQEKADAPQEEKPPTPTPEPEEPAAVHELGSDAILEKYCVTKRKLCLLAFLDPLADQSSHEQYLKVLLEVAEKNKQLMSVVWIDVAKQPDFFLHFDAADIPSLRLWNKKNGSVANVIAAMTPDSLNKFIGSALGGRVRMGTLSAPPALVEGGVKMEPVDDAVLEEEAPKGRDEL